MTGAIGSVAQGVPLYGYVRNLTRIAKSSSPEEAAPTSSEKTSLAYKIYGDDFKDPSGFDMAVFRERTREFNSAFEREVSNILAAHRISPDEKFEFVTDEVTHFIDVRGSDAVKQAFSQEFAKDPSLQYDILQASAANDMISHDMLNTRYYAAWRDAAKTGDQGAVWARYREIYQKMEPLRGMTHFENGTFTTAAREFIAGLE